MQTWALLDLSLHQTVGGYRLHMKFRAPDQDVPREAEFPTSLNPTQLGALELEAVQYGQALYRQLFAERAAEVFFSECRAAADPAPLRLRLGLRPDATELHRLHWETLRAPSGDPLTTGDRVWFSRYLFSDETRDIPLRPRADLRALMAIANPAGSGLSPVDVKAERERILKAWGDDSSITVLDGMMGERATLPTLTHRLREGYDVVYLLAHGKFNKDESESALWLEDEAGNVARVRGAELLAQLDEIANWPRLIVLLACQSAQADETRALLSLGPRLSARGIPAVLAMQGDISMKTSTTFMEEFFRELRRSGQIDQACATARSAVRQATDAWMPVLFLRSENGRLWPETIESSPAEPTQVIQGPQTNITGNVTGPVLSGQFNAPVNVGNITVGDISHSTGVAIGPGAQTVVNMGSGAVALGGGVAAGADGVAVGGNVQGGVVLNQETASNVDELARVFAALMQKVNALPAGPTKEDAHEVVTKLEAEAKKADQADAGRVRRSLEFLVEVLPDAWEVTVNTILNPLAGLNTVFRKIAERVKAEHDKKKAT